MKKLLIIDDDEALRGLLRKRLAGTYEVFETGEPEHALALALEHKPDAILLDLRMPKFDGFELCRNFRSLTYTSNLPVFVVTGESGRFKKECADIGAAGYFEKPIDFARLRAALASSLRDTETKPRSAMPVCIRVELRLQGRDARGVQFEERVSTENISHDGFKFASARDFAAGCIVDVFLTGAVERRAGTAHIVERLSTGLTLQSYRAIFDGRSDWILQNHEKGKAASRSE